MDRLALLPVLPLLTVLAAEDASEQRIDGRWLLLPVLLGFTAVLFDRPGSSGPEQAAALLPGLFLLAGACGGGIGSGDALTFLSLGFWLPAPVCLRLLLRTLLLAGVQGAVIWLRGGRKKDLLTVRLPLLPWVLAAWLIELGSWL